VRKAGVMAIVVRGGVVRPGDPIAIELPPPPLRALAPLGALSRLGRGA
jgi:MOSC domain-containing protein YiiM